MTHPLAGSALRERADLALSVPLPAALGAGLLDPSAPAEGAVFRVANLALNGASGAHAAALSAILELAACLALLPYLAADEHAVTHASSLQLQDVAPAGGPGRGARLCRPPQHPARVRLGGGHGGVAGHRPRPAGQVHRADANRPEPCVLTTET